MVEKNSPSFFPSAPFNRPLCAPKKSAGDSGNAAASPTNRLPVQLLSQSASLPSMRLPIASTYSSSSLTTLSTKPSALVATASSSPVPQPDCPIRISPTRIRHWQPKQHNQPAPIDLFPASCPLLLM